MNICVQIAKCLQMQIQISISKSTKCINEMWSDAYVRLSILIYYETVSTWQFQKVVKYSELIEFILQYVKKAKQSEREQISIRKWNYIKIVVFWIQRVYGDMPNEMKFKCKIGIDWSMHESIPPMYKQVLLARYFVKFVDGYHINTHTTNSIDQCYQTEATKKNHNHNENDKQERSSLWLSILFFCIFSWRSIQLTNDLA